MSGAGVVTRDEFGVFRAARAVHYGNLTNLGVIEAWAARESLILAHELGLKLVHLEGDSQHVINLIQWQVETSSEVGVLIADVNKLRLSFDGSKTNFVMWQFGGSLSGQECCERERNTYLGISYPLACFLDSRG
ncbi:hypothetical protein RHMOL_Rhmol09G0135900 [Rhododendron molle]|uniref:Uncharacterized protein n=1 Tax=Rhododendron molle TaxID=49168 RepID=A0ACC0MD05_RHOML|nr:hypothetical protein RHMOL_Rhmol09G0135900 [Rhododendron molle]